MAGKIIGALALLCVSTAFVWIALTIHRGRASRTDTRSFLVERLDALIALARDWTAPGLNLVRDDSAWTEPDRAWRHVYVEASDGRWVFSLNRGRGVMVQVRLRDWEHDHYYPGPDEYSQEPWLLERIHTFLGIAERLPWPRTSQELLDGIDSGRLQAAREPV